MLVTLRNDFHNTEAKVRCESGERLSLTQVRRAWKALCGIESCTCNDGLGTRGPQEVDITPVGASWGHTYILYAKGGEA